MYTQKKGKRRKEENILKYYDRYLKIEKERTQVRFLDGTIIWDGESLRTVAYNKNEESMKETGLRRFKNILPATRYKKDIWKFLYQCFLLVGNNYMSCPQKKEVKVYFCKLVSDTINPTNLQIHY